ncbi:ABC transporter permease [Marinagarivorans cellulosilyticus]|uniref:Transport permease protein n=1 Tax=Marinagarivorans cellulosilyticus TaxID=2721545 RepID=A0AAN1WIK2_9GAMM|nr:ABC transporter permease [Marinagarivorans cellulosilyticus]BCD98263.1 ABC-2 type transport system permease protein [Marinagarivorans cellulosilyticus]
MNAQQTWVAFVTLVRKEVKRFTRIWVQTLLPPVITMSLYFIIFGKLIGERIGEMSGTPYIAFVVPGLVMMAVINNSYANVVSSFFSAKLNRSIEELQVSPTPSSVIIAGYVAGGALRGLIIGLLVTALSFFFTDIHLHSIAITLSVIVLAAILFALAGFINATFANSFDDINIIPTFILTPLTYLGGVFYSIDMLPTFGQVLSQFNPILYLVNSFRYGMLGISDINIAAALSGLIFTVIILYAACWYLLEKSQRLRQ